MLAKTDQPYRESISLVGSRCSGTAAAAVYHPRQRRDPRRLGPGAAGGVGELRGAGVSLPPAADGLSATVSRRSARRAGVRSAVGERPPEARAPPVVLCWTAKSISASSRPSCPATTSSPMPALKRASRCSTSTTCVIADLTVQGFQLDGISLANSARNVSICRRDLPRQRTQRHRRRRGVDGRDRPLAVGRQRRGPTAHVAVLGNAPVRFAPAVEHGARLGRSGRPRRSSTAKRVEGGLDEFHPAASPEKKP